MEPNKNPQTRKIVFTAPGMNNGVAMPTVPSDPQLGKTQTSTPSHLFPPIGKSTGSHDYNPSSLIADKKDTTVQAEWAPGQPLQGANMQRPVQQAPGQPANQWQQPQSSPIQPLEKKPPEANPAFRSYAHDIKTNVSDQGVTMAQIIMEEERKKQAAGATQEDFEEAEHKGGVLKTVLVIIGIIAILGGAVALFITFRSVAPVQQALTPEDFSLIRAQRVAALELRDGYKNTLLQAYKGVAATRIPTETFVELKLYETVGTSSLPVGFTRMMQIMDTRMPDTLLRGATGDYVVGIYGGAEANVPFIMFNVDAFENGYVGMRDWEKTLMSDIGGLFVDQEQLSVIIASSTPSLFQDKVYYNKDTRVVFGNNSKPLLVWAIVNRTQIVITRDGETLNALMKRMTLENITR